MSVKPPRVKPHDSVCWALSAWYLRDNYLPLRKTTSGSTSHDDSFIYEITEAAVLVTVFELVRRIELRLKANLARYLRRRHGSGWWQALPLAIQKSAAARHRWAVLRLGSQRAGGYARVEWLTFGDLAKALRALPPSEWQTCLNAETKRREAFDRSVARVKAFRDRELAHPRPTRMTNQQIRALCSAIQTLPQIVCPTEWARVLALLAIVTNLSEQHQRRLADDLNFHIQTNQSFIQRWLACPVLEPPEVCMHSTLASQPEVLWREAVLLHCAELDAGRRVFFSYGEPLVTANRGGA